MAASRMFALAATALLCACNGGGGDDDNLAAGNQPVSAEGKARDGTISVKAPGVDISISVPKELTGEAKAGKDMTGFDVVPTVPVVVGDDLDACAEPLRRRREE